MHREFECLGGPLDGKKVPQSPDGFGAFCVPDIDSKGGAVLHFYRFCVTTKRIGGRVRTARFWHYIGTNPEGMRRPTMSPPRKMYQ
jgi:hypothetical protein